MGIPPAVVAPAHVPSSSQIAIPAVPALIARPRVLGLLLDVRTRWNSTYAMLKRALDLRPAIDMYIALASDAQLKEDGLTEKEWLLLKDIMNLFKPLFLATVGLSQSKYTSLSLTLPIYMGLLKV